MNGMIFIILINVDHLLIFVMKEEMKALRALLTEAFKSITMEIGRSLSYLGMQIEWTAGGFEIRMDYYSEQLAKDWSNVLYCAGPGTKVTLLKDREWTLFHSTVACTLYLVKRIRTKALTETSFCV